VFFLVEGKMQLAFRDKIFQIKKGELIVLPKATEHKTNSDVGCVILLIEPIDTLNTGDAERSSLTDTKLEWI
jgi:mannose-6-phosphate isomerase-like protein (cupin superfamily)